MEVRTTRQIIEILIGHFRRLHKPEKPSKMVALPRAFGQGMVEVHWALTALGRLDFQ